MDQVVNMLAELGFDDFGVFVAAIFNGIVQNLKRFVETEVLSLDPLRMTMHDVLRAKELVEQLIRASEEVRMRVLGHLGQVEDVVRFRNSSSSRHAFSTTDSDGQNLTPAYS